MHKVHDKLLKLKKYFNLLNDIHSEKLISDNPRLTNLTQITSKTKRWLCFGGQDKILLDIFLSETDSSDIICSDISNYDFERDILDNLSEDNIVDDIEFFLRYGRITTKYDEKLLDEIYNIIIEDYYEKK